MGKPFVLYVHVHRHTYIHNGVTTHRVIMLSAETINYLTKIPETGIPSRFGQYVPYL